MRLSTRTTNMILALVGPMLVLSYAITKIDAASWVAQMLHWTAVFGLIVACANAVVIEVVDMFKDVIDYITTKLSDVKERIGKEEK